MTSLEEQRQTLENLVEGADQKDVNLAVALMTPAVYQEMVGHFRNPDRISAQHRVKATYAFHQAVYDLFQGVPHLSSFAEGAPTLTRALQTLHPESDWLLEIRTNIVTELQKRLVVAVSQ